MSRLEKLKNIYESSNLMGAGLEIRLEDDRYPGFSSLRFKKNRFLIRAIEIWGHGGNEYFKIYYSENISENLKSKIDSINGRFRGTTTTSSFYGNFNSIANELAEIL